MNPKPPVPVLPKTPEEMLALIQRAEKGDQSAVLPLRELLKDPELVDFCGGDLARLTQRTLLNKFAGKNLAFKEALAHKLELMRADLTGPTPTPLERLLVERVVACWLHLYHLEQVFAQKDSMSLELGTYYQRNIDRAHKRYLSAIKTLAVVRKLALPVLQVNLGRKQVNVACVYPAAETSGTKS
jgi:hypothetical protein